MDIEAGKEEAEVTAEEMGEEDFLEDSAHPHAVIGGRKICLCQEFQQRAFLRKLELEAHVQFEWLASPVPKTSPRSLPLPFSDTLDFAALPLQFRVMREMIQEYRISYTQVVITLDGRCVSLSKSSSIFPVWRS